MNKSSFTDFIVALAILVGLSLIVAPILTSVIRNLYPDLITWQNGGLLDPNGAPPLAILTLIAYVVAGLLMAKLYRAKSVGYAVISSIIYILFQLLNFGWVWQLYNASHVAPEILGTTFSIFGLTVGTAFVGSRFIFNQK